MFKATYDKLATFLGDLLVYGTTEARAVKAVRKRKGGKRHFLKAHGPALPGMQFRRDYMDFVGAEPPPMTDISNFLGLNYTLSDKLIK
ncbi:MAG: hypothetical protein QM682_18095 [Paracoccus sp. (in: a-proteobacteria)]|uniref:hypothetical protein n=1 Tax=Paracoccus sp. TaxID=267 RepID=UPI0039E6B1C4